MNSQRPSAALAPLRQARGRYPRTHNAERSRVVGVLALIPFRVEPRDRLLLVSEGATKSFGMAEMAAIVEAQPTGRGALQALGRARVRRPSGDDVTVVAIDVGDA